MASLKQWDTEWFDRFRRIYATNISMMALAPTDALAWIRIADEPYGIKQVERPVRKPDQDVQVAKNEEFTRPKYAASEIIRLDMPAVMDELRIKEEYYAGDTANALGHVADLNANYKRAIMKTAWLGTDTNPYSYGIVEDTASASTYIYLPGHADTASAITTAGAWSTYQNLVADLATAEGRLEDKGFFGQKAVLAPNILRPFLQQYVVDYTAVTYPRVLGYPLYFNPYVDTGATVAAAAIYMVDTTAFELHMTPVKVRSFWSDEQECYTWRWKTRSVPVSIPKHDGTDYLKGIVGFDIDVI